MTALHDKETAKVIFELLDLIRQRLPKDEVQLIAKFARHYYAAIDEDELKSRDPEALYHSLMSHWAFVQKRKKGEIKCRVYNPSLKKDGWTCAHTVIEVSQEDKPFLVDSLILALNRLGLNIHFTTHVGDMLIQRDGKGQLVKILASKKSDQQLECEREAQVYVEVDQQPNDAQHLQKIEKALHQVLEEVTLVVGDFPQLKGALTRTINQLKHMPPKGIDGAEIQESIDFLNWMNDDHFTFLGYAGYQVKKINKNNYQLTKNEDTALGILGARHVGPDYFGEILESKHLLLSHHPILITKSSYKATVHRSTYMDVIIVKEFDASGETIGEHRFIGLYTSSAYHDNPKHIPLLRRKVAQVIKRSGYNVRGHDGKALVSVLENLPRDGLFQMPEDELYRLAIAILQIQERQRIRLFMRQDIFGRFVACMVFVPRDVFNTELRLKLQQILMKSVGGFDAAYTPNFLENGLCRMDFVIPVESQKLPELDHDFVKDIESRIVKAARNWSDDLSDTLKQKFGESQGIACYERYRRAFPVNYQERFSAEVAVTDIEHVETVLSTGRLSMCFYRMLEDSKSFVHFKMFQEGKGFPLSDVIPILENMGMRVVEERPYEIKLSSGRLIWVSDFGLDAAAGEINLKKVDVVFKEALYEVWCGRIANDGFNSLTTTAAMPWQQVLIFRAYAKYFKQIGFRYSQSLIESTLAQYPDIAGLIAELFAIRFNPALYKAKNAIGDQKTLRNKIYQQLDNRVSSLDCDRILRCYVEVILATIRTNYYQKNASGNRHDYVSFKLRPALINGMPLPHPAFEIFVYSPRVEGVHLRGSNVARGGLRWSDRKEDFRTEVLGLMKAQQVKNAVIVPMGAKGGFVPQNLPTHEGREAVLNEAIACYKIFISGLLDITDNLQVTKTIPPKGVICYDEPDPYLVVAADKGTASFSDIANGVAQDYGFWLGDAFASGGSYGYDHKKMGITARGAWESVKRHFLELGHDTQTQDFTVVGIGDMAGDVFGNGMLLSKHIQLVAAFNHMHIFIDPNPNAAKSYAERQRLFNLPRSSWADYNAKLISQGGGVFERSAKRIQLNEAIKQRFDIVDDELEPNELIKAILKAPVDLLWNGGIGTYVKAMQESHHDVGDRANDLLRVNATELRCRVVGEGGNLGFTQRARVEYALHGGLLYTDAIDNSAGVDCSDHEVNIKILLNQVMRANELDEAGRNKLLRDMEIQVGELVLKNNYMQTQAISSCLLRSDGFSMQVRVLEEMIREKKIDIEQEALPSPEALSVRKLEKIQLTAPEFSVLMAHVKLLIKRSINLSTIPEEAYFERYLKAEFPEMLVEKFGEHLTNHRLKREIIATQLANDLISYMGITFVHRMYDETGATPAMSARAFVIAFEVLEVRPLWEKLQSLAGEVDVHVLYGMMNSLFRMVRRAARWFLKNCFEDLNVERLIARYQKSTEELIGLSASIVSKEYQELREHSLVAYEQAGVPKRIAQQVAKLRFLSPMMDIVEGHLESDYPLKLIADVYTELGLRLSLGWMRDQVSQVKGIGYWELLVGSAMRDDLDKWQRVMALSILRETDETLSIKKRIDQWLKRYDYLIRRWNYMLETLKRGTDDLSQYASAMRALVDVGRICMNGAVAPYRMHEGQKDA